MFGKSAESFARLKVAICETIRGIMEGDSDSKNRTVQNLVNYGGFGTANQLRRFAYFQRRSTKRPIQCKQRVDCNLMRLIPGHSVLDSQLEASAGRCTSVNIYFA